MAEPLVKSNPQEEYDRAMDDLGAVMDRLFVAGEALGKTPMEMGTEFMTRIAAGAAQRGDTSWA